MSKETASAAPNIHTQGGSIQPDFDLQGRVVLITGASSGLGAHFAQVLAGLGAHVVCAARRVEKLADVVDVIHEEGGRAQAVAMDVNDEASVKSAFDAAADGLGCPQVVIANAGMNMEGSALDMAVEDFDAVMNVNLRGVFLTAREGARRMIGAGSKETGQGRIILIASMAGLRPLRGLTPYSVSKAGVVMMAKGLALEWARHGINVNAICPGYIATDINGDWLNSPAGQKMIAAFPRKAVMPDTALDGALVWLSSAASRHTTGAVIQIDDLQGI
ncbi:MAG: hypothetical protein RL186_888 [Pseudomonadota bacterium]